MKATATIIALCIGCRGYFPDGEGKRRSSTGPYTFMLQSLSNDYSYGEKYEEFHDMEALPGVVLFRASWRYGLDAMEPIDNEIVCPHGFRHDSKYQEKVRRRCEWKRYSATVG